MEYLLLAADSLPAITTTCDFSCVSGYSTGNTVASPDCFELTLVEQGAWAVQLLGREYPIRPGEIKVYPPMVPRNAQALGQPGELHLHRTVYCKSLRLLKVLSEEQFQKQASILKRQKLLSAAHYSLLLPVIIDGGRSRTRITEFRNILREYGSGEIYARPKSAALLLQFLTGVSDQEISRVLAAEGAESTASASIVQRMLVYLNEHFASVRSMGQIASALGYHPSYLSTVFRKETGYTTIEYINKLRVERAKELIQGESLSFQEIAGRVGVDNVYYFYRIFKKYAGMTMGQYARMLYR